MNYEIRNLLKIKLLNLETLFKVKNIGTIENIQRRFWNRIKECKGLEYPERLRLIGLTTVEERMERADI